MRISSQGNSLLIASEGCTNFTTEKEVVNHPMEARGCSNSILSNSAQLRKRRLSIKSDFQVVEIELLWTRMQLCTFFSDEKKSAINFIAVKDLLPFWRLELNAVLVYHSANLIICADESELI
jgi:hypothetical protein